MQMRRLTLLCLLALSATAPAGALSLEDARHILGRVAFAPTLEAVNVLAPLDRAAAVEKLLGTARRSALSQPPGWAADWTPPRRGNAMSAEDRAELVRVRRGQSNELKAWWASEMITTPTPITEIMTLFWHNHFTSSLRKVRSPVLMYRQNVLLRRHALGNFGEMLRAISRDPAMLVYLDNASSRREAPNENFARELLELFTLGEGRYAEADIKEIARAFTGWTIDRRSGTFANIARRHDQGEKSVFGQTGRFDGDDVVDILLAQPSTAILITTKLWHAFVSDQPDTAEIERLAALLRASDYELAPLMTALLTGDAFWAPANRGTLIRSPIELLVGTVRLLDIEVDRMRRIAMMSRRLGQDLFDPPNVKGWPGGASWITSERYLARQELLRTVTYGPAAEGDAPMAGRQARGMGRHIDRWVAALPGGWKSAADLVTLMVPLPPVDTGPLDPIASGALVRGLLNDPVYQLK